MRLNCAPYLECYAQNRIPLSESAFMAEDHIRYDILAQEALRGVVRKVLSEVVKTGLPGEHHFFTVQTA